MNAEEIQAIFFAECEESLAAAEQGLKTWRATPASRWRRCR